MKPPLSYRLQEWAADRFDSVQYPPLNPPPRRLFEFRYKMPLYQRIAIIVWSLVIIVFGFATLAFGLFCAYIFIKVAFA
jgi:hypothetical protein